MITCKFEDGGDAKLRHATVAVIILNDKNEVLLGKRSEGMREGGKYNLPGGFIGRDESITQAAMREVKEETGYDINLDFLLYIMDNPKIPGSDWQNVAFIFVAHIKQKVAEGDNESSELRWFELENLPPKDKIGFDHLERLEIYKKYLKERFPIPFFRSSYKS